MRRASTPAVVATVLLLVMLAAVAYVDMRFHDPLPPLPAPVPSVPSPAPSPDPMGPGT